MRISTRSWPACDWTSDAYLAACWAAAMWSILSLIPVSFVNRWPISASFLSMSGAKLFQQRYEISRCWPRAGGMPVARTPARPAPVVVVRKWRRVIADMTPPLSFTERARPGHGQRRHDTAPGRRSDQASPLCICFRILRPPVPVPLAEHLLVELPDAGLGDGVDDLDLVGQRPSGELRPQEVEDLRGLDDAPRFRHHAGEGPLDPLGMAHRDDRRLEHLRVRHDQVLDVHARDPLAARLDQVLGPVGDLDVALGVDRGDVPGAEPTVRREAVRRLEVVVVRRDDPGTAHLELAHARPVPRQLVSGIVHDASVDTDRRVPDAREDVVALLLRPVGHVALEPRDRSERRHLGHAPGVGHLDAEVLRVRLLEAPGRRRAADRARPQG